MLKSGSRRDLVEVNKFLQINKIVCTEKLCRAFSDARPLAQLLKQLYPKLVELHNYPMQNSTEKKFNNWVTLNCKVLKKLGLAQSKQVLEQLTTGTPGAIENLLYNIMQHYRATNEIERKKLFATHEVQNDGNKQIMVVYVSKTIGDAICKIPQKMIVFSAYRNARDELTAINGQLVTLRQKITHLENLLDLKSEYIGELCTQLSQNTMKSLIH